MHTECIPYVHYMYFRCTLNAFRMHTKSYLNLSILVSHSDMTSMCFIATYVKALQTHDDKNNPYLKSDAKRARLEEPKVSLGLCLSAAERVYLTKLNLSFNLPHIRNDEADLILGVKVHRFTFC